MAFQSIDITNSDGSPISPDQGMFFWGDNKEVMKYLLEKYRAKVDCIYLDPPFDVGSDFGVKVRDENGEIKKITAFSDKWCTKTAEYKIMAQERMLLAYELLAPNGSFFLHCDWRTTAFYRNILDEIFQADNYVNEIIWFYKTGGASERLGFSKKHDTIHYYVKDRKLAQWYPQKEKSYLKHRYGFSNIEIQEDEGGLYSNVNCRDVFDIPALRGNQPERVNYPTQKPEALLERLILATTKPGDLVADFFCGSGTTGVVAQRLKRRWILVDQGEHAIEVVKGRMAAV